MYQIYNFKTYIGFSSFAFLGYDNAKISSC